MSHIITIDRTQPFDPVNFPGLGKSWSIEEQNDRSLSVTQVDLDDFAQSGHRIVLPLDAKVAQTLMEHQESIPESWKGKNDGQGPWVYFDDTVLRDSHDQLHVLCMVWDNRANRWHCGPASTGRGKLLPVAI